MFLANNFLDNFLAGPGGKSFVAMQTLKPGNF
jgi:hypothetical protein